MNWIDQNYAPTTHTDKSLKPTHPFSNYLKMLYSGSWAVLIGVEKFQHAKMRGQHLDTVMNDVNTMKNILSSQCGYPPDSIITITGSEATSAGIKTAFDSILPEKIHEDDRLLVFYSGHGASRESVGKHPERGYLVTYDTRHDGNNLDWQSMLQMDELIPYVEKRIKARQMLFLIDCCFSGLIDSHQDEGYRRSMCPADMHRAAKKKSVQIYAAGGKDEEILASSGTNPPISVFVESIKCALSNVNPTRYQEGFLSAFQLARDATVRTRTASMALRRAQHPEYYFYSSDESGEFVFKQFSENEIKSARERPGAVLEPIEKFIQDSEIVNILEYANISTIGNILEKYFPDGYSPMQLQHVIDHILNSTDWIMPLVNDMVNGTSFTKEDILGCMSTSILSMGLTRGSFIPIYMKLPSEARVDN